MNKLRTVINWIFPTLTRKNSRTVHYAYSLMFAIAAVVSVAAVVSTEASYVRLESNVQMVEAGEQFRVLVYAYAHTAVNAVDIALQFSPEYVEVIGVDRGESVITLWTEDPRIEDDRIVLSGGTYQRGFLGEHLIATVRLRAKAAGRTEFLAQDVRFLAGDGRGTQVSTIEGAGTVSTIIYDENTDPETIAGGADFVIVTDLDGDGQVTLRDISVFMSAWAGDGQKFDFNNDNRMTFRDFSIILAAYFFQNR